MPVNTKEVQVHRIGDPVAVNRIESGVSNSPADAPAVAVSPNGANAVIAWMDKRAFRDLGNVYWTFGPRSRLPEESVTPDVRTGYQGHPAVVFAGDGTAWCVWEDGRDSIQHLVALEQKAEVDDAEHHQQQEWIHQGEFNELRTGLRVPGTYASRLCSHVVVTPRERRCAGTTPRSLPRHFGVYYVDTVVLVSLRVEKCKGHTAWMKAKPLGKLAACLLRRLRSRPGRGLSSVSSRLVPQRTLPSVFGLRHLPQSYLDAGCAVCSAAVSSTRAPDRMFPSA